MEGKINQYKRLKKAKEKADLINTDTQTTK